MRKLTMAEKAGRGRWLIASLAVTITLLFLGTGAAQADIGAVSSFGNGVGAVAINQDGAGGASAGDVYALGGGRVQQFSASGEFIRAFGLDVGGPGVNVCTVLASCQAGTESDAAGGLRFTGGESGSIAIDQSTGNVYVSDVAQHRVNIFSATGEFEGAFGWKVKVTGAAEELQLCTNAGGCQAGSTGAGTGQFGQMPGGADRAYTASIALSPLNGHLVASDQANRRIEEFAPEVTAGKVTGVSFVRAYGWGAATGAEEFQICTTTCHAPGSAAAGKGAPPGQFGKGMPGAVAVNSQGVVYATDEQQPASGNIGGRLERVQTFDAAGSIAGSSIAESQFIFARAIAIDPANDHLLMLIDCRPSILPCLGDQSGETGSSYRLVELDAAGNLLSVPLRVPSEELSQSESFDVNAETGTVYLEYRSGVVILGTPVPPNASVDPVSVFTGTTATFTGHVNPTGFFATYRFEYSSDGVHWSKTEELNLPPDSNEHAATAEVSGLEAHTHYQVRLVIEKKLGGGSAVAETTFETASAAPLSKELSVRAVSDSGARLTGFINPENEATTYAFQCVTQKQFETTGYAEAIEVPPGGGALAAKGEGVEVAQQLAGLSPATAYRCRLIASNGTGQATPAELGFSTYSAQAAGLPDGRAYEQATPVDKNGADANGWTLHSKAALNGDAVTYFITGGGSGGEGGQQFPLYVASRSVSGWANHGLLPPSALGDQATVAGWSEDLERELVLTWNEGSPATLYLRNSFTGALEEIAEGMNPHTAELNYAGESADGSRVLFESKASLLPEAIEGASNLYLWNSDAGALSLVSVLPDESPANAFAGPYYWTLLESKKGGSAESVYTQDLHVLSGDGSKAFFTTSNVNQLYVRKGIGTSSPSTAQVSATQKTNGSGPGGRDPKGPKKAAFMEATPDGHYVFFTSQEELTNDATTGTADQGNDLYRYDTESGQMIDVAPDSTDANGAEVQGVIGSSEDGSYVYFVANGVLAEEANPGSCHSNPATGLGGGDKCSLYLWHNGTISLVAPIEASHTGASNNWQPTSYSAGQLEPRASHVSADGRTVLFASTISPTSYDSEGKYEFYRYNTDEGLTCVSCNPTGAEPVGDAEVQDIEPGFVKPRSPYSFLTRNLSADGKRVFFESPDKLVASDTNGDNGCPRTENGGRTCQDVYEWEAEGTGSCNSKVQDGGCIYLISTGESDEASYFVDASADGSNVFFLTRQSLVRQDDDKLLDVYDARVGGGIAAQNAAPPTPCEGEACREGAAPAPGSQTPGTSTFSGPPNPKAAHKKTTHRKKKRKHAKKKRHQKRQARSHR